MRIKNEWLYLLAIILAFTCCWNCNADTYQRSYNPTSGSDAIESAKTMAEFDAIGTVINGNLGTENIKNGTLLNEDLVASTIETDKIKDGTLTPADMANLQTIAAGSLVYASALSTFGELAIGTSGQVLTSDGTDPYWATPSSSGWTDSGSILYPDATTDNVSIGGTTVGTNGEAVLSIFNGTVPTASVTDGIMLYAEDVTASSELKVRDEAGNITTLSPHNFSLIPEDKIDSYSFPWSYYSKNEALGVEINVDMYGAVRELEKISGETFIYENDIPQQEVTKEDKNKLPKWLRKKVKVKAKIQPITIGG